MTTTGVGKGLLTELLAQGHLIDTGVLGVYGRGKALDAVIGHYDRLLTRAAEHLEAEFMRFPPLMSRADYERTDHLETMPQLLGSVHSFSGSDAEYAELVHRFHEGQDWTETLSRTSVVLPPAACYPVYPTARGTLPEGGRTVDICSYVFRHEPSEEPTRMMLFRQREFVRLGTPDEALAHRDYWIRRGLEILRSLGLRVSDELANDPFFGRGGRVMKATQREQNLKYELVVPVMSEEHPTAIASSNCHLDHFSTPFGIHTADGSVAHTACVGFGLERGALALFAEHGMDPDAWPGEVRSVLEL